MSRFYCDIIAVLIKCSGYQAVSSDAVTLCVGNQMYASQPAKRSWLSALLPSSESSAEEEEEENFMSDTKGKVSSTGPRKRAESDAWCDSENNLGWIQGRKVSRLFRYLTGGWREDEKGGYRLWTWEDKMGKKRSKKSVRNKEACRSGCLPQSMGVGIEMESKKSKEKEKQNKEKIGPVC